MPKTKNKKTREPSKFTCEVCGTVLSSSYNLRVHRESNCSKDKKFKCQVCDSRFLTQHYLKTHLQLHFGEKQFVCSQCGNRFLSKGQLKVHERKHTQEKPFVCGECGKGFKHRESLVTHSTIHTGIKPYICECCSSTFSCVGNLIKHRKVRPDTCGLPIYTNKKICKRAGVKCRGDVPKIIVDTSQEVFEKSFEEKPEEDQLYLVEEVDPVLIDHEYVSCQSPQDEDYTKKEMDVFDYIGYEIKIIEEQEKLKNENEVVVEELMTLDESIEESLEDQKVMELDESIEEEQKIAEEVEFFEEKNVDSLDSCKYELSEDQMIVIETLNDADGDEEMKNYVEVKEDGAFHCRLCPKIYQKKNMTMKHLKSEHQISITSYNYDNTNRYRKPQKTPEFKCKICPKRYTSKRLVERHESCHGPNFDLVYKCVCCSLHFRTDEEAQRHQFSQHIDRLRCKVAGCEKTFDHPEKLSGHAKYAHSGKKSAGKKYVFVCQLCGRNFNTKVALSDHERSNCGKAPIYVCVHCDKSYHSAGSLKCHMTIHTNELQFDCNYCDKRFRTKGQLTVHLRSHTKEKNFKCIHCPAAFSHRESLLTHNTLHTGIKRFECSSCHSRFSCISNLLAHRKSHKNTCGDSQINKVSDAANSVRMLKTESISD